MHKIQLVHSLTVKLQLMKNIIFLTIALVVFCFSKCRKEELPSSNLPAATQEGKNTIGFILNEEVWVPYAKCSMGSDPCGEISARYSTPSAAPNGIGFQFARLRNGKSSSLTIYTWQSNAISTIGEKIDSIGVEYSGENSMGNNDNYAYPLPGSKFVITKIDHQNQIIAGEFEFILQEQNGSGKTIRLKDGRFDFKFNACKCSN